MKQGGLGAMEVLGQNQLELTLGAVRVGCIDQRRVAGFELRPTQLFGADLVQPSQFGTV
jgi:hypothetical protein